MQPHNANPNWIKNIDYKTVVSIIASFATVISTWLAIQQSRKVKILKKQKHRLTWDDMEVGVIELFKKIESDYKPEIVVCLSERGTAIVTIGYTYFARNYPIFTGFWQYPEKLQFDMTDSGFVEFYSRQRKFYLSESIFKFKDKRFLIIDDWAFTGQAIIGVYNKFLESGIAKENIRCASLVTSPAAKASLSLISTFYYNYLFEDNNFSFPWGKAF